METININGKEYNKGAFVAACISAKIQESPLTLLFSEIQQAFPSKKGYNEWQPIDTAPKDGTNVLVCNVNHYEPITASYRTYHPNAQGKKTWRAGQMGNKINPTHWMWQLEAPID